MARLKTELTRVGLNLSVWDVAGRSVIPYRTCVGGDTSGPHEQAARGLADRVVTQGIPQQSLSLCGGLLVGVPVWHRRRVAGAAIVCFPTSESACSGANRHGCGAARYACEDAESIVQLLNGLVEREQALHVAQDELSHLSNNLATSYEELSLLYRITRCMRVTGKPEDSLQVVLEDLLEVMNIEGAIGVVRARPPGVPKDILQVAGAMDLNTDQINLLVSSRIAPRLAASDRPMLDNHFAAPAGSGLGSAVRQLVAVPLVDNEPIGMLLGVNKRSGEFNSTDLKLLSSIANQAEVILANNRLYADLQDLLMGVLHALSETIDAKDPYTHGHSRRVAMLSRRLAERMGLSANKVHEMYLAGLLHDIGKIGVPENVLCKTGKLTEEEFEAIKRHPGLGAKILQGIRQLDAIVIGIVTHHERPDGGGYPCGLRGDDIPLEGRIVGLADVFDAMTSDRTYRRALDLDHVISEIRRCCPMQFDKQLVGLLLDMDIPTLVRELRAEDDVRLAFNPQDFAP
jgi:hypothetical protein